MWNSFREPGRRCGPISRPARRVKSRRRCLPVGVKLRSQFMMDDNDLSMALERADRALERIERALARRQPAEGRDEVLRARVREVVEELDELIREVAA